MGRASERKTGEKKSKSEGGMDRGKEEKIAFPETRHFFMSPSTEGREI